LSYLAAVQQEEGAFPAGPFRRMPADAHVTAAILYFLGEYATAYQHVRISAAADWLDHQIATMSDATRVLWRHGKLRCRLLVTPPVSNQDQARLWAQVA
jgi:hypothetical protein